MKSIKTFFLIISISSLTACNVGCNSTTKLGSFMRYINDNKVRLKMDTELVSDKPFNLEIPIELSEKQVKTSDCFTYKFLFEDGQKIIIFYFPTNQSIENLQLFNLSLIQFEKTCETAFIANRIDDEFLKGDRRFGIKSLSKYGFCILYLNVKKNRVKDFNYSIASFHVGGLSS